MEDNLIEVLESLGYPVRRQGSLGPKEPYPQTVITFWGNEDAETAAYDNETLLAADSYSVFVYSADPTAAYDVQRAARDALKAAGWIILSRGYDVDSDEITHIGRGFDAAYLQTLGGENNA